MTDNLTENEARNQLVATCHALRAVRPLDEAIADAVAAGVTGSLVVNILRVEGDVSARTAYRMVSKEVTRQKAAAREAARRDAEVTT